MRTTLDIDAALLNRLRAEATRRGVPFKDVVAGAIRRGLDVRSGAATKHAVPALPSYSMGAPSYNVDKALRHAAALEDEETVRKLGRRK